MTYYNYHQIVLSRCNFKTSYFQYDNFTGLLYFFFTFYPGYATSRLIFVVIGKGHGQDLKDILYHLSLLEVGVSLEREGAFPVKKMCQEGAFQYCQLLGDGFCVNNFFSCISVTSIVAITGNSLT